jgi:hypothetical protein
MNKFLKFFIITLMLIFTQDAFASVLDLSVDKNTITVGTLSNLEIKLDTQNNLVNTIEGDFLYDNKLLKVEQINTGSSFISFWVDKPVDNGSGTIHFSGVVPGGISITNGTIFSVVLRGKSTGNTSLKLDNVNLFLNDGEGSKDTVSYRDLPINIGVNLKGDFEEVSINDKTVPEKFKIVRSRDESIFDNKWFIVFSTQDKGVGIDYYTVCEFYKKYCTKADSPYLLKHQNAFYYLTVNAYDLNGNIEKSVLVSPWLVLSTILIIFVLFWFARRILYRYFRKYKV